MHHEVSPPTRLPARLRVLGQYCLLSYVVLLAISSGYLRQIDHVGWLTRAFAWSAWLTYSLGYLLPPLALAAMLDLALGRWAVGLLLPVRGRLRSALVFGCACLGFAVVQLLVLVDRTVFARYGFHLNGFVWNLVVTPGGLESLGGSAATWATFGLVTSGIVAVQAALLAALLKATPVKRLLDGLFRPRRLLALAALIVALAATQAGAYAHAHATGFFPVLVASEAFPFFQTVEMTKAASRSDLGPVLPDRAAFTGLRYPLRPIARAADAPSPNIVWLVAESWRADALDPEVMPRTWAFSRRSLCFRQHYSSGNTTRMGVFGMFYGLYGPYWWAFLKEQRPPVLMDLLFEARYQFFLYTSARFTYPEFNRTVFAHVPSRDLHDGVEGEGWQRDAANAGLLLDAVARRDRSRPFMAFLFLDTTHAPYSFPKEAAEVRPYLEDVNYAALDPKRDWPLLKNRYLNACRHLDRQIGRILAGIEEQGLLDSTIVLVTGDHGQEFMEKGRWGHNSAFTEEQVRVPLVVWVPDTPPAETARMTSHLDMPATLLARLGVTNPPSDYSLGMDLLGTEERRFAVVCSWQTLACVTPALKATLVTKPTGLLHQEVVTTRDDAPAGPMRDFLDRHRPEVLGMMRDLARFNRMAGAQ
jgi:membrane-anchored protein YejM (alkaline phosphatase superfamily)